MLVQYCTECRDSTLVKGCIRCLSVLEYEYQISLNNCIIKSNSGIIEWYCRDYYYNFKPGLLVYQPALCLVTRVLACMRRIAYREHVN